MSETTKHRGRLLGSLERRLPLTIGGLLAAVVIVLGIAAYREVRQSSLESAQQRLATVANAINDALSSGMTNRGNAFLGIARTSSTREALANAAPASVDTVHRRLAALRGREGRALLATELRTATGQVVVSTATDSVNSLDEAALHSLIASIGTDSVAMGPLYSVGDALHYWVLVPVDDGDRRMGYIAERRLFRPQRAEAQLRTLTGHEIDLFFTTRSGEVWATSEGNPVPPPLDVTTVDSIFSGEVAGETMLGRLASVPGTDWVLVYLIPEAGIIARAVALAKRTLPFSLGLLLIGAFAGWLITRGVTRPLRNLASAADSIAAGDYSRRVEQPRDQELQQLASAFNRMAERVGASHDELASRNEELRAAQAEAIAARNASEQTRVEAQRANEAKTAFLAMMSHELRTPLSAIGGYTEILQLGLRGSLNDTQQNDLERIRSNQVHLLTIINDMLDLSQIESGQLSVHCEPVPLDEVLTQVEPIVGPLVSKKRLSYEVDASVRSLAVHADRERLRQVLVNLISNAARYSESGGTIRVHSSSVNGRIAIHVSDTGIGIPAEKLDAIFEPFVQVDAGPTRRSGGTGLGLPISRRLAEAMSGTLLVTSEVGVGSTFTLELRADEMPNQRPDLKLIPARRKQIA